MRGIIWSVVFLSVTCVYSKRVDSRIPFFKDTINFYNDATSSHDKHRCGVCPTYFDKICAFDEFTNATFIFDNHCVMDMYNCVYGTVFHTLNYDHCMYFGNFAYVHGFKKADLDYDEDQVVLKGSKKNPDFVR